MQKTHTADIWIVDDLEADQELLRIALEGLVDDDRLRSFYSAEATLEAIEQGHKVRLILLDLQMPGMGGRGFLKEMSKQSLVNAPIIVYSSSHNPEDVRFCYEYGASAFLPKPPDLQALMDMIGIMGAFWFKHALLPPD
jgi:CheY-like chemotaxis protein